MADYLPLIARAVEGLEKNTGENRRALYERARTALVAQLRGVSPPLDESEITRERLALEEAIRKIEAESARRAREEQRAGAAAARGTGATDSARRSQMPRATPAMAPRATPVPPSQPAREPPASERAASERAASERAVSERAASEVSEGAASATERKPSERTAATERSLSAQALRGFRESVSSPTPPAAPPSAAPQPAQPQPSSRSAPPPPPPPSPRPAQSFNSARARPAAAPPPPPPPPPHPLSEFGELEPRLEPEQWSPPRESRSAHPMPPSEPAEARSTRPRPPRSAAIEDDAEETPRRIRIPLAYGRYARIGLAAAVFLAVIIVGWTQRGAIQSATSGIVRLVRGSSPPARPANQTAAPAQTKITDRIAQPAGLPSVAQRAVLYEEDPNDPQGKRYVGTAVWRTEMSPPAPGRAPELTIRADVTVPERHLTMTWSLRRNSDRSLPASHTIEIAFNLPPGDTDGVQNVPGVLMKQAEATRGTPLAGLAVKVTPGFFLIGLSSLETDMQRNLELLKERSWFDIPIVYNSKRRAILAMEKGTPGEQAFKAAFAAWKE